MNTMQSTQTEKSVGLHSGSSLNGAPKMGETGLAGIADTFRDKYEGVQDQVKQATDSTLSFFKKYPMYSVAGAAAVGIVIGWMMHSRKSST